MIWSIRHILGDFKTYDRPVKFALISGGILLLVALGFVLWGDPSMRSQILVGAGLIFIVMQIAIMFANRHMIADYSKAQRAFLSGDMTLARNLLEEHLAKTKLNSLDQLRTLTLLGNTYRQLGMLSESHSILYEAVDKAPKNHFARYGFGRTLLMMGEFDLAVEAFQTALELGAPSGVHLDIAEAQYLKEDIPQAVRALNEVSEHVFTQPEAYRTLMRDYLLFKLCDAPPPSMHVLEMGLPYWEATLQRFQATPYVQVLEKDVAHMRQLHLIEAN